jgi:hypothetical protein
MGETAKSFSIEELKARYKSESDRRQRQYQEEQDLADVRELNRRVLAVKSGKEQFCTLDEAKTMLKELGVL